MRELHDSFVPHGYTPQRKWPIILYLHGASARGTDGRVQTATGLGSYVKAHAKTFPFLVVFLPCENVTGRILTGWSKGGYGAWSLTAVASILYNTSLI